MQPALNCQRRLVVQQTDKPIVLLEDQLAGEKDRIRKLLADRVTLARHFLNRVSPETQIRGGRHAVAAAEINKELQRGIGFGPHLLDRALAAIRM